VVNLRPKAKMVPEVTTVMVGEELVIWSNGTTDTESDMALLLYTWDVDTAVDSDGDGDARNDADHLTSGFNPLRHTYDTPGTKIVRLTVSDEGYTSSVEIEIVVQPGEKDLLGMLGTTAGFSNLLIVIGLIVLGAAVLGATTVLRKGDEGEAWVDGAFEEVDTDGVSDDDLADDGSGTAADNDAESDSSGSEEE
jgi:PKD repeat protein